MKRLSLALSFILAFATTAFGQVGTKYPAIEYAVEAAPGKLEIIYEHTAYDPIRKTKETTTEMLQADTEVTYQRTYNSYRLDSALMELPATISWVEISQIHGRLGSQDGLFPKLLWQKEGNLYSEIDSAMGSFIYQEEREPIAWELLDTPVRELLGVTCREAKAEFRGREWHVWYSPEIPMPIGPYKLGGLPGAVLEASSTDGHHFYTAIMRRNAKIPIIIPDIPEQEKVLFWGTREQWYKAMSRHHWNFSASLESSGIQVTEVNGDPIDFSGKTLFYAPIELDWMTEKMLAKWLDGKNPIL